jgi:hypothetical protein
MAATPTPMITPPASSLGHPPSPKPTMNRPMPTTATASSIDPMVIGTLYRIGSPGTEKPSIAMKCMAQIPTAPMDTAARTSQRARAAPS